MNSYSMCRSDFHVVHPMAIEFPRSMPLVVTHWNLPMHVFLKNCEEKCVMFDCICGMHYTFQLQMCLNHLDIT